MAAKHHINGSGCPKCNPGGMSMNTEEFIRKACRIHNNYYTYNRTKYIRSNQKVEIECPKCSRSKGEIKISSILDKYSIPYIPQYNLDINGYKVRIDFYVNTNQK